MTGVLQHLTALGRDALVEVLGLSVRSLLPGAPLEGMASAEWDMREGRVLKQVIRSRSAGPLFSAEVEEAEAAVRKPELPLDEWARLLARGALLRTAVQEALGHPDITTPEHAQFLVGGSVTRALAEHQAGWLWLAAHPFERDRMLHNQARARWMLAVLEADAEGEVTPRKAHIRHGLRLVASAAPSETPAPAAAPGAA